MPTRGSKDPNGRALRGRRAHTTFALLTDPARQIWNSFNNRANAGGADAPEAAVNGCLYDRFKSLYNKTATKPSLVIVPARFKSGTLYSQIPSSNADFTVTRPLNTATRFDSSALIQTGITSGVPRLDYYTSSGVPGCPALLVEPSGTNLCLQSENFLTTWAPSNITVTTGTTAAFTAPDGTTSADLLTASASGSARIIQSFTFVSGTTYSYSAFAKAGSGFFGLTMENGFVASGAAVIWNLNTGALAVSGTTGAGYTLQSQGIENYGNGWYRCRMTVLLGLNVAGNIRANTSDGTMSNAVIQSASGNTAYIWGAQLETGSVATSYIPTTAGTGSRSADVISVSGAVSGSIGQQQGTIYAEVDLRNIADTKAIIQSDDGTADNRLILFVGTAPNRIQFLTVAAGANSVVSGSIATGINKIAASYFSGSVQLYLNGSFLASGTPTAFPTVTRNNFSLGTRISAGVYGAQFNDRIRAAALYTTRLSDAELQSLTQP